MSLSPFGRRHQVVAALAALGLSFGLAACGGESSAADGDDPLSGVTITLGQNDPSVRAAINASGIFDDAPYKVEFVDFSNQVEASTALTTGDIDGSVIAQYTVVQAAAGARPAWTAETAPYKTILVPGFVDTEKWDPFGTVASKKSGITELTADAVRGKKWTASPGATNYLTMLQTLDYLGLSLDDIEYVPLDNAAGAIALLNNEVDLVSGAYSSYFDAIEDGAKKLLSGAQVGPGSPGAVVATTKSLDDPVKGKAWEDFVSRYVEYRLWVLEHEDEWVDAVSQVTKISPDQARQQYLYYGRGLIGPVTEEAKEAGQGIADVAFKNKAISQEIDAAAGYDDRFTDVIEAKLTELDFDAAVEKSRADNQ